LSRSDLQFVALWNYRQPTKAKSYSLSRTQQHVWSLVRSIRSTSYQFSGRFTGYRSSNAFCSSWRYWFTSASMGMHLSTWLMTAAWSAAAGPVLDRHRQQPNWRSHWPERRLATDFLLSTAHVNGTVYRRPFTTHRWHSLFSATDSRHTCLNS